MFAVKPPFPTNIESYTVFPHYENTYYEFKRNLQTFDTLTKAICGMLNRKGGYVIFGIDDETHKICGIHNNRKLIDDFAQYIDKITGHKQIITAGNAPLEPDNILVELVPHPVGLLVVLNITPLEGVQYKLRDGSSYVRLNASTWNLKKEEQLYREVDVQHIIHAKNDQLNRYKEKTQKHFIKLHGEYDELDKDNYIIRRHLFQKILQEKDKAELELVKKNYNGILCIISGIFCCT
jgi:predicted HTH transcriptional regulator